MIMMKHNKLLVKGGKLCSSCCMDAFVCAYTLVNGGGFACWPPNQVPDHLIVEFVGVRRCCDDSLITELNTKHCLAWSDFFQTYFGCVAGVDINGSDYNLILAFGDSATNGRGDIFVTLNSVNCVWNRWPVDGCLFSFDMGGIPCPPIPRNNSYAIGNCGGAGIAGSTIMGYGGSIMPTDPSGQL